MSLNPEVVQTNRLVSLAALAVNDYSLAVIDAWGRATPEVAETFDKVHQTYDDASIAVNEQTPRHPEYAKGWLEGLDWVIDEYQKSTNHHGYMRRMRTA